MTTSNCSWVPWRMRSHGADWAGSWVAGGYMVGAGVTAKFCFDLMPGDIYWCTADCGWITGAASVMRCCCDLRTRQSDSKLIHLLTYRLFVREPASLQSFVYFGTWCLCQQRERAVPWLYAVPTAACATLLTGLLCARAHVPDVRPAAQCRDKRHV